MRRAKRVVFGLRTFRKPGNTAELSQRGHGLAATRQDLVGVGLVADIPDDTVVGGVEHIVQSDRQLDRAEVGRQVAARARDGLQHALAQLVGDLLEVAPIERLEIGGRVNSVKKLSGHKQNNAIQSIQSCQKPSVIAHDDEIRDSREQTPGVSQGLERVQRLPVQLTGERARTIQPE